MYSKIDQWSISSLLDHQPSTPLGEINRLIRDGLTPTITAADHSKGKDSVHLIQARVVLNITLLLYKTAGQQGDGITVASLPISPVVTKTWVGKRGLLNLPITITILLLPLLLMMPIDGWDV